MVKKGKGLSQALNETLTRHKSGLNNGKLGQDRVQPRPHRKTATTSTPRCPECGSKRVWRDGLRYPRGNDGAPIQRWLCRECGYRFSEKNHNPSDSLKRSEHHQKLQTLTLKTPEAYLHNCQVGVRRQSWMENLVKVEARQKQAAGATKPDTATIKGLIVQYVYYLEREGYYEESVYPKLIRRLAKKGTNLLEPEHVKTMIAKQPWQEGTKRLAVCAYDVMAKMLGIQWTPPKYQQRDKMPFVPLESELDTLINACGKRLSTFLQALKETGADPGELLAAKWTDINEKARTLTINHPVKGHRARILPISKELISRLNLLPRKADRIFPITRSAMYTNFWEQRKRIARNFNNPRIQKITFRTFRHWKATMEYHKTRDPMYVKTFLGHKTLDSTMIYINIEKAIYSSLRDEEFTVRVTQEPDEIKKLLEAGFEYVCQKDQLMFFRKRK